MRHPLVMLLALGLANLAPAADLAALPLGDFSRGLDGWELSLGTEFPGAKGSLTRAAGPQPDDPQAARLTADFAGGGRYVAMSKALPTATFLEELTLRLQGNVTQVGLRLTDAQGQSFQQYLSLPAGATGWQTLTVREFGSPGRKDIFHWGGANDGVWRGPLKRLALLLQAGGPPGPKTLWVAAATVRTRGACPDLEPVGAPVTFYLAPDAPGTVQWTWAQPVAVPPLDYLVSNYQGAAVARGQAQATSDGRGAAATLTLPRGYYEIAFPGLGGQTFGLIVAPPVAAPWDLYFGVDGAFSCFPVHNNPALRRSYLAVLQRSGIGTQRERLMPSVAQFEAGTLKLDEGSVAFRREAASAGIEILELLCPASAPKPNPYPTKLSGIGPLWQAMQANLGPAWKGTEVWNEPDLYSGGSIPGDRYVALQRAIGYAADQSGVGKPICGGVFNHVQKECFDTYAINGLLDHADVFAYHIYRDPERVEDMVASYRQWCREYGREDIPFWMTEAGSAWRVGPPRPPRLEAADSAMKSAMKAIECKACGNARYFAFLLGYFDEGRSNWGLHGRENTPLRGMAAYTTAVRHLAHGDYLGDLQGVGADFLRARVFARPAAAEAVIVLYTGRAGEVRRADLAGLGTWRAEGIDGRSLAAAADGSLAVSDGLAYVFVARTALAPRLDAGTRAAALARLGKASTHRRVPASPLILLPEPDAAAVGLSPKGYLARNPDACTMQARLVNLGAAPRDYALRLRLPPGVRLVQEPPQSAGRLDAQAELPLAWTFDLGRDLGERLAKLDLTIEAENDPNCRWTMRFLCPERVRAPRAAAVAPPLAPDLSPEPGDGWRLLAERDYVPLGVVLYDGRSKVWARCSWLPGQLLVDVLTDKAEFNPRGDGVTMWQGDSVQLAFQGRPGERFTELTAALTAKGPRVYRHHAESGAPGKVGPLAPACVRIERAGRRTLYAFRLPADQVDLPELHAGLVLRLALVFNYHDGASRSGYFHWGDGIVAAKAPAEYLRLELSE